MKPSRKSDVLKMNDKEREKLAELRFSNLERYFDLYLNQLGFLFALTKQREVHCGKGNDWLKYKEHVKRQEKNRFEKQSI